MSLRAVFDTNILISASLSLTGTPFHCLALARAGEIESVTCQEILDEFREKLVDKFSLSPETAALAVSEIRAFSHVVSIPGVLTGIVTDPDDHKVLECAVAGSATHIVTGDRRHLLPLQAYQGIAILSAADFLHAVSTSK